MVRSIQYLYCFEPFRLNAAERLLWKDAETVALEGMPLNLLLALIENAGHLIPREELITWLWPKAVVLEHGLTVHMNTLRRALGDRRETPQYIQTVRGYGYRFIAPVTIEKLYPRKHSPGRPIPGLRA